MHDQFWKWEARQGVDWYEPEPARAIFLAAFLIKLGEIRYGPNWSGAITKPSEREALPLMKEIAQAAASGAISTLVVNPKTWEFQPVARAGWRNPKALAARFSRCRIDASDPVNSDAEGRHHGPIYIERAGAISYLESVRTSRAMPTGMVSMDHLSTYVRFLIFVAQNEKIDDDAPIPLKSLQSKIAKAWKDWRISQGSGGALAAAEPLSPAMIRQMATLLRGEKARAQRLGGGAKK